MMSYSAYFFELDRFKVRIHILFNFWNLVKVLNRDRVRVKMTSKFTTLFSCYIELVSFKTHTKLDTRSLLNKPWCCRWLYLESVGTIRICYEKFYNTMWIFRNLPISVTLKGTSPLICPVWALKSYLNWVLALFAISIRYFAELHHVNTERTQWLTHLRVRFGDTCHNTKVDLRLSRINTF